MIDEQVTAKVPLAMKHVDGCRVYPNRRQMIRQLILPGQRVAELGVRDGQYSRIFWECEPDVLHLVDTWRGADDERRYQHVSDWAKGVTGRSKCKVHRMDSVKWLRSQASRSLHLVYLDSDHRYAHVKSELYEAQRVVLRGGTISGHDYMQGSMGMRQWFGVIRAVNEFVYNEDWRFVALALQNNGAMSWAIRRPERQ